MCVVVNGNKLCCVVIAAYWLHGGDIPEEYHKIAVNVLAFQLLYYKD